MANAGRKGGGMTKMKDALAEALKKVGIVPVKPRPQTPKTNKSS